MRNWTQLCIHGKQNLKGVGIIFNRYFNHSEGQLNIYLCNKNKEILKLKMNTKGESKLLSDKYSQYLEPKKTVCLSQDGVDAIKVNSCSLVFFDLETSGMAVYSSEILQISAICKDLEFNEYITPTSNISPFATQVNHLYIVDGVLFYKDDPVDSVILKEALRGFLNWLKDIPPPRILLGHNVKRFDCPHLFSSLSHYNMVSELCELAIGFIDTLPLFKQLRPDMPNHKQDTLVQCILGESYEAHNAIEDVKALQKLVIGSKIENFLFLKHSFTSDSIRECLQFNTAKLQNIDTYFLMRLKNGITKTMADKFSSNGILYKDLIIAFHTGGKEELKRFLGRKESGKVVGTVSSKVIERIVNYMETEENIRPPLS